MICGPCSDDDHEECTVDIYMFDPIEILQCRCPCGIGKELNMKANSLGFLIDELYERRIKRSALETTAAELKEQEGLIKKEIIDTFSKDDIDGAKGKLATAAIIRKVKPKLVDWNALCNYVVIHEAFDLLYHRVAEIAYKDRLEACEEVAGVERFDYVDISLTKR